MLRLKKRAKWCLNIYTLSAGKGRKHHEWKAKPRIRCRGAQELRFRRLDGVFLGFSFLASSSVYVSCTLLWSNLTHRAYILCSSILT